MHIYTLLVIVITITCLWFVSTYLLYQKRQSYIINFDHYTKVLDYYLEKAFDLTYKDKILVFSMEGMRPKEEDFKKYTSEFTKLVIKMLGPTLLKEFTFLCGNIDTFIFTIVEYFNARSESDEIRQASIDQLMNTEDINVTA